MKHCLTLLSIVILALSCQKDSDSPPIPPDPNAFLNKWVGEYRGFGKHAYSHPYDGFTHYDSLTVIVEKADKDSCLNFIAQFDTLANEQFMNLKITIDGTEATEWPGKYDWTVYTFENENLDSKIWRIYSFASGNSEGWEWSVKKN